MEQEGQENIMNEEINEMNAEPIMDNPDYFDPELNSPADVGIDFAYVDFGQSFFINLFLLVVAFVIVKFIFAKFIFSSRKETNINQNTAYSFSLGSVIVSMALIVTSSVYGELPQTWYDASVKVGFYCGIGIVLIIISGFIFDKLCLVKVDLAKQISNDNLAAAIVDGGNFIASALVIMAILIWAQPLDSSGLATIVSAYLISQLLLSLTTIVWVTLFKGKRSGESRKTFQEEIESGNLAVAIDFFGKRIATALAINIATTLLAYQSMFSIPMLLRDWFVVAIMSIFLLQIFAFFASRVVIGGYRNASDKIAEGNIATALISSSIYIAFGIILDQIVV